MTTEATAIKNVHRQASKVTPTLTEAKAGTVFAMKLPGGSGWRKGYKHTDAVVRGDLKASLGSRG